MSRNSEGSVAAALWRKTGQNNGQKRNNDDDETTPLLSPSSSIPNVKGKYPILENVQIEIDNVKSVANSNITKVLNRGEKLDEINNKAETLHDVSDWFKKAATKVQDKAWIDNFKVNVVKWLTLGLVGLVIVGFSLSLTSAVIGIMISAVIPKTYTPPFAPVPAPSSPPIGGAPGGATGGSGCNCNCVCPPVYFPPGQGTLPVPTPKNLLNLPGSN